MHQLSLPAKDLTPWDVLLGCIESAVHHIGLKEVTFKLNVAKSTLCDALKDRNDRRWAQEWTVDVLIMLRDQNTDTSDQLAHAILTAQAVVTGRFEVVSSEGEPTPEEIATAARVHAWTASRKKASR